MNVCPMCGYCEHKTLDKSSNVMNIYINPKTKHTLVLNRTEKSLMIGEVDTAIEYIRKDIFDAPISEPVGQEITPTPMPIKPASKPSSIPVIKR